MELNDFIGPGVLLSTPMGLTSDGVYHRTEQQPCDGKVYFAIHPNVQAQLDRIEDKLAMLLKDK